MWDKHLRAYVDPAAGEEHRHVDCRAHLGSALGEIRELQAFQAETARRGWLTATNVILAACLVVFGAMMVRGVGLRAPSSQDLLDWGACHGPLIKAGQWWRLVTSVFVHIGVVHLAFNGYATWILGRAVERLQGAWRLAVFFAFGALAGGAASLWWSPLSISAGASGGLFGVAGALGAMYLRFRRDLPALMRQGLRSWLTTILFYNAIFLVMPGIDAAAHVGGIAGGFLMGLALARPPRKQRAPSILGLAAAAALLAAALAFTVYAIRRAPDTPQRSVLAGPDGEPHPTAVSPGGAHSLWPAA
jgi:rhomboid protease GluP